MNLQRTAGHQYCPTLSFTVQVGLVLKLTEATRGKSGDLALMQLHHARVLGPRVTAVFSSVKWTCCDWGLGGSGGLGRGTHTPRRVRSCSCHGEGWRYLGDRPAELLELLQGPGLVQEPVGSQHEACEHGLPGVEQSAGSPRQPLEPTSGGVEPSPGMKHI